MAFVVAEPCIKCKYTDCVAVCPVDCFYEGENMLVIHPDECIDCGACEPECPATAIFDANELPEKWEVYTGINAVFSGAKRGDEVDMSGWPAQVAAAGRANTVWPQITEQKEPMPDADDLKDATGKLSQLSGAPQS